ncbi:MAG: alpha/beta fold hydrolase, partial [Gammaproteobacteria bacterium]|nr:alpha/beta fold hydrolase [Gammaproteobacteria bacterium]
MTNPQTVVLIHGLWMNKWSMFYLGRYFKRRGYQVYYFSYPSVRRSLEENLEQLHTFIEQLPAQKIDMVGHSLGGILCLNYLQKYGADKINHCVLLGSP